MTPDCAPAKPLTGRKVLVITITAFAVIIGVNLTMAYLAIRTFPGLEVANSYVASQNFDRERRAQQALGWTMAHTYQEGAVILRFADAAGAPVRPATLLARVGRSTEAADDQSLTFLSAPSGFRAPVVLGRGKWVLMVQAMSATGQPFRQRIDLIVSGATP